MGDDNDWLGLWAMVVVGLGLAIGVAARADQPAARADEPAERELMKTEKQIQANLQSDRDLANNRIDVQVSDGVATLKGTVDSEAERSRAVRLAGVAGVRIVDDQLKVESLGSRRPFRTARSPRRSRPSSSQTRTFAARTSRSAPTTAS